MEFLRDNQLDIMLFLSGICAILAFMTMVASSESSRKKSILTLMELSAMLLLLSERFSYIYRGDPSELGSFMVRVSNGLVFFLQLFITHIVTEYLRVILREDGGLEHDSRMLRTAETVFGFELLDSSELTLTSYHGNRYPGIIALLRDKG